MKLKNKASVLLTFDVEEFDIPLEYKFRIDMVKQMEIGKLGLEAIMHLFDIKDLSFSFFTTANFAQQYPTDISRLSIKHEIASHTFYHSSFKNEDLAWEKQKQLNAGFDLRFFKNKFS